MFYKNNPWILYIHNLFIYNAYTHGRSYQLGLIWLLKNQYVDLTYWQFAVQSAIVQTVWAVEVNTSKLNLF